MVRTQIYLTEEERDGLTTLSQASGKKRSELIREAVNRLIQHSSVSRRRAVLDAAAGIWHRRKDLPDFSGLRKKWDRGTGP